MNLVNLDNRSGHSQAKASTTSSTSTTLTIRSPDVLTQHEEEQALIDAASFVRKYNYDLAVPTYLSLADKGSTKALSKCFDLIAEELGVKLILKGFIDAYKQGSLVAPFLLWRMYKAGGIPGMSAGESSEKARQYFQEAYQRCVNSDKQESPITYFLLGCMYEAGGVPHISAEESSVKAVEYFQKAYEKECLDAGLKLVRMCVNSNNKNSLETALSTIISLSNKGQPYRCDVTGFTEDEILELVDDAEEDDADNALKVMMTLLYMVESESVRALEGWCGLLQGGRMQHNAVAVLFNYLTKEHEVGEGRHAASLLLGMMYDESHSQDIGVEKNNSKRMECYEKANSEGSTFAARKIGDIYNREKKDLVTACKYYQKGAEQGDILSMYYLGAMYKDGKGGLEKDYLKACHYYQEPAKARFPRDAIKTHVHLVLNCINEKKLDVSLVESVLNFLTQSVNGLLNEMAILFSELAEFYLDVDDQKAEVEIQRFFSLICRIMEKPETDAVFAHVVVGYLKKIDSGQPDYSDMCAMVKAYDYQRIDAKYSNELLFYRVAANSKNEDAKNSMLKLFLTDKALNDDLEFTKKFLYEMASGQSVNAEAARSKLDEISQNVDKRLREEKELNESVKKARHF